MKKSYDQARKRKRVLVNARPSTLNALPLHHELSLEFAFELVYYADAKFWGDWSVREMDRHLVFSYNVLSFIASYMYENTCGYRTCGTYRLKGGGGQPIFHSKEPYQETHMISIGGTPRFSSFD